MARLLLLLLLLLLLPVSAVAAGLLAHEELCPPAEARGGCGTHVSVSVCPCV